VQRLGDIYQRARCASQTHSTGQPRYRSSASTTGTLLPYTVHERMVCATARRTLRITLKDIRHETTLTCFLPHLRDLYVLCRTRRRCCRTLYPAAFSPGRFGFSATLFSPSFSSVCLYLSPPLLKQRWTSATSIATLGDACIHIYRGAVDAPVSPRFRCSRASPYNGRDSPS